MEILSLEAVKQRLGTPAWRDVPFMRKEDLRERRYDLTARADVLHWFSSSGSTAMPVLYPWTAADVDVARQTLRKVHSLDSELQGKTAFVIAPTGLPGMWYHMNTQLQFIGMTTVFPGGGPQVIELIEHLQPKLLMSLPLVLSRLGELYALHISANKRALGTLFTGGDVISTARRQRIEAMWGAQVQNFYGLSEVFGPVANESEEIAAFVWQAEQVFVEILDPHTHQPVDRGKTGVAVITTLWDRPASLVRYWTGDCFRLLQWLAPGRPLFQMRGRQQVSLPALKQDFFPIDVDEILLTDPAAGNEWAVAANDTEVEVIVEAAQPIDSFDQETKRLVENMFNMPVRLVTASIGALSRLSPKLGVIAKS